MLNSTSCTLKPNTRIGRYTCTGVVCFALSLPGLSLDIGDGHFVLSPMVNHCWTNSSVFNKCLDCDVCEDPFV